MTKKYFKVKVINEDIEILVLGKSSEDVKTRFEKQLQRIVEVDSKPIFFRNSLL